MDSDKPRSDEHDAQRNTWVSGAGHTLGRMARQAAIEFDEIAKHAKKALGIEARKPSSRRIKRTAGIEVLVERLATMIRELDADRVVSLKDDPGFWSLVNQLHQAHVHKPVGIRRSQPSTGSPATEATKPNRLQKEPSSAPDRPTVPHPPSDPEVPHASGSVGPDPGLDEPHNETNEASAAAEPQGATEEENAPSANSVHVPHPDSPQQTPRAAGPVNPADRVPSTDQAYPAAVGDGENDSTAKPAETTAEQSKGDGAASIPGTDSPEAEDTPIDE